MSRGIYYEFPSCPVRFSRADYTNYYSNCGSEREIFEIFEKITGQKPGKRLGYYKIDDSTSGFGGCSRENQIVKMLSD